MGANDFLAKIKANGTESDVNNLAKVYADYKDILTDLPAKERGTFSLNVLCLLCRNIDKVPSWTKAVDTKDLLTLTIDCVRECRGMNKPDQVKTLACIYHIHRYVARQNSISQPELILKLSFMPFEYDTKNLLIEYCKTYWNIIADRLTFIEKLKGKSIHKLLPSIAKDVIKTIEIYDTVQFCSNVLVFVVKKLHYMYNETCFEQLNVIYGDIFKTLASKKDVKAFKSQKDDAITDLYVKFCECIYVIGENASKSNFKDSVLSNIVRSIMTLVGFKTDIFHCLQTFFVNGFCDIFENKSLYIDAVFKNLAISCEITEKLGYKNTMRPTYVYLNQFLRLFIEYSVSNDVKSNFTEDIQENCLKLMIKIVAELKNCEQSLKCENCKVKSGYHDSLRLSFLLKHFITFSLKYNYDITNLTILYNNIIIQQYKTMESLKNLGCVNYEKCFRKLQTDTHNTAILLNKNQKYEFSIQLFDIYLKNELISNQIEPKNLARAFYNKSICEIDNNLHENALLDAFLSLIFSEDLNSEKYMSLVMDIKAKALKFDGEDDNMLNNDLQVLSVYESCKKAIENNLYGDLKPYFRKIKFSNLLKHEYMMYGKLWPSILPIAGVWKSLNNLLKGAKESWIGVEDADSVLWSLFEVISFTPSAVRTIHSDEFKPIVYELLERIEKMPEPISADLRAIQVTLLFLAAEYDLADASNKYGWKISEPSSDPDNIQVTRTLAQEFDAIQKALSAVEIWTGVAMDVGEVTNVTCLHAALRMSEIFVQVLLHLCWTSHGLQLADGCCVVAERLGDKESYVRNSGVILNHIDQSSTIVNYISTSASAQCAEIINDENCIETVVIYLCDAATYFYKIGSVGTAAKLVELAQYKTLKAYDKHKDINLDLAMARLLEAQFLLCPDSGVSSIAALTTIQRIYLSSVNNGSKWAPRRLRSCYSRRGLGAVSLQLCAHCGALRLRRRARCSAAHAHAALTAALLASTAACCTAVHRADHAQVTIDNRLKYILGLRPAADGPHPPAESKLPIFTPKLEFETMLESQAYKHQLSPTRKYMTIPGYTTPEFFEHQNCDCYACQNIPCSIIAFMTGGLEASMYFRANEIEIANNYFKGVIGSFKYFDGKLKRVIKTYLDIGFKEYIVDYVKNMYENEFREVKLQILIEAAFFEMKCKNFDIADDYIVTIHEILQESDKIDGYLNNEVMNLLLASAKVRNVIKRQEFGLENEFENLKISPKTEIVKTPESKVKIPTISARKVKEEDVPKKRKVIKLNLDEGSSDEKDEKTYSKKPIKSEFKIPVPVLKKPELEAMTPRSTRKQDSIKAFETPKTDKKSTKSTKIPDIVVTQTPKIDTHEKNTDFFTPASTPEQFFTPLTNIKTYSKQSLHKGIVKNLELEFSTPKSVQKKENKSTTKTSGPSKSGLENFNKNSGLSKNNENIENAKSSSRIQNKLSSESTEGSRSRKKEDSRSLKRTVSPGKSETRPRRTRQPKI